jgi:thiosulfate/3-mercaptopyruvate sulfurtransferase
VSGFARPELLASPDWLADHLGRPEVRVLDVRWRPDGTGRAAHLAGHLPGAVHLDWAADLVDSNDSGGLFLLAGPDRSRPPGRAGAATARRSSTTTPHRCSPPVWWSLGHGFDSVRILDGVRRLAQ